jgi:quercetin dioxygenase-like cupin family protein
MTGVSKSMLGQIERGDSSPTIAVVWKIAKEDLPPLLEDNGRYRLYPFFPNENGRRFEIYTIEIDPGGSLHAEAHPENTIEFITQFEGELTVQVDEQTLLAGAGGAIRFRADRPHSYHNLAPVLARASLVIQYPG